MTILTVAGLKCYTCSNSESQEACSKKQTEMDCGKAFDRCATIGWVFTADQVTTKPFPKLCSTKTVCDNSGTVLKACEDAKGETCEYKCCDNDLCNNGAAPMVSTLLMVVCTVVRFFR